MEFRSRSGGVLGGAAAAVSAGLSSFEIGTDIGGSIRFSTSFVGYMVTNQVLVLYLPQDT